MSGLEVAGLVLGAFPIALEVLAKYKEMARRLGFWYRIAAEHKKCDSKLKYYLLVYENNLKKLLLPLAGLDDKQIDELLQNPTGSCWTKAGIAESLEKRLGGSYDIYMGCMVEMREEIEAMNRKLAFDVATKQPFHGSRPAKRAKVTSGADKLKDQFDWQFYRVKFSQGEKERNVIFANLENCNERLKNLLQISEDNFDLEHKRGAARNTEITAMCRFWRQASRVFTALSVVWSCNCRPQHFARLLLEHRASTSTDFHLLYSKKEAGNTEEARRIRITEKGGDDDVALAIRASSPKAGTENVSAHNPNHRDSTPKRSAMKSKMASHSVEIRSKASALVTITHTGISSASTVPSMCLEQPIKDLCQSVGRSNDQLCGFMTKEDYRYYVYQEPVASGNSSSPRSITLDRLLRPEGIQYPTRRQRVALAFILSSSFLQLLESPWLSASWQKSDVVFFEDPARPGVFKLDEPHLDNCLQKLPDATPQTETSRRMQLASSLETLGIVLLELCFGKVLGEQSCRLKFSNTGDCTIERALDMQAAKEWHGEVEEEAGHDYSVAVGWCLGGILSTPPDRWRETMHGTVVRSLESCHKYLQ